MKMYCQSCGSPTEYTLSTPKFCSCCGTSFNKVTASQPKPVKKLTPKVEVESEEDLDDEDESDGEEVTQIPDTSKLTAHVEVDDRRRKTTIRDLACNAPRSNNSSQSSTKLPSKKAFLAEWQKEAGTLRPTK